MTANLDRAQWDSRGPRAPPAYVRLLRPSAGETLAVVLVSPRVVGLWLHWVEGRTVPCLGEDEGCPWHDGSRDWEARWKGFAAAVRGPAGRIEVAEITGDAWARCPELQHQSDVSSLRGRELRIARARGGPRKPVTVWLPDPGSVAHFADRLPPAPDVRAMLAVLFQPGRAREGPVQKGGDNGQEQRCGPLRATLDQGNETPGGLDSVPLP